MPRPTKEQLKNYLIDCLDYAEIDLEEYANYKDLYDFVDLLPNAIEACKDYHGLPNTYNPDSN